MLYSVLHDIGYDDLTLLGEYTEEEIKVLTEGGFYCDKWSRYLKFERKELTIIDGTLTEKEF